MGNWIFTRRMLVENCIGYEPYISLGVIGQSGRETNPYKNQVIRIDKSGPLYSMVSFKESNQYIQCEFENDIELTLMKRDDEIIYFFKTPDRRVTQTISKNICRFSSNIDFHSRELDLIFTFLRNQNNSQ